MPRRHSRGFTLIEIMVVICIIGILLLIVLPNMVHSKYQAQWTACGEYQQTLAAALESYNASEGTYPSTLQVLTTTSAPYINAIPSCPSNNAVYSYEPGVSTSSGSISNYTLSCSGSHYLVLSGVSQGFPQYNPQIGLLLFNATH